MRRSAALLSDEPEVADGVLDVEIDGHRRAVRARIDPAPVALLEAALTL